MRYIHWQCLHKTHNWVIQTLKKSASGISQELCFRFRGGPRNEAKQNNVDPKPRHEHAGAIWIAQCFHKKITLRVRDLFRSTLWIAINCYSCRYCDEASSIAFSRNGYCQGYCRSSREDTGGIAQKCSGDATIPEETKWQTKLVGFTLCFGTDLSPLRPQRKNSQQGVHSGDADPDDLEISANHDRMEGSIEHSVSVSEDDRGTLRCHRLRFEGP